MACSFRAAEASGPTRNLAPPSGVPCRRLKRRPPLQADASATLAIPGFRRVRRPPPDAGRGGGSGKPRPSASAERHLPCPARFSAAKERARKPVPGVPHLPGRSRDAREPVANYSRSSLAFFHAPPASLDATAAETNLIPRAPSSTIGTHLARSDCSPARCARMTSNESL